MFISSITPNAVSQRAQVRKINALKSKEDVLYSREKLCKQTFFWHKDEETSEQKKKVKIQVH